MKTCKKKGRERKKLVIKCLLSYYICYLCGSYNMKNNENNNSTEKYRMGQSTG